MESEADTLAATWSRSGNERRFANDLLMRKMGWRIVSRPERGPAVWVHESGREATDVEIVDELRSFEETRPEEFRG